MHKTLIQRAAPTKKGWKLRFGQNNLIASVEIRAEHLLNQEIINRGKELALQIFDQMKHYNNAQ